MGLGETGLKSRNSIILPLTMRLRRLIGVSASRHRHVSRRHLASNLDKTAFVLSKIASVRVGSGLFEQAETLKGVRFMAYAMAYATHADMKVLRHYVSDDDFREALDKAPPGIIDPRSWAYWNSRMGRYPAPPLPRRMLG